MEKLKNFFSRHYYSSLIYVFILFYNFIIFRGFSTWNFHKVAYSFHLVDFSMGFCSKFLPGAIYNFLFNTTDERVIIIYETVLLLTFVFIVSLLLEKLIIATDIKNRPAISFLLLFFITGSSTFSMYVFMLGSLDSYWLFLSIIFILLLADKRLYIFIAPVSVLLVIVHYASIIAFVPFFILLMLYKISITENKKEQKLLWTVLIVSAISAISITAYFIIFESHNLTYSMDEFIEILQSKNPDADFVYYVSSLYEHDFFDTRGKEFFSDIDSPFLHSIDFLLYRIKTTFVLRPWSDGIIPFILNMPIVILIVSYLKKKTGEKDCTKLKAFTFFCISAMFFATIFLSLFLSTDTGRFVGHAYMLLFTSFLYIIYKEKSNAVEHINKFISRTPKTLLAAYCLLYLFVITEPFY